MTPRTRIGALGVPLGLMAAGLAWWAVNHARIDAGPEDVARGRAVARARCQHCHAVFPLAPRVAGWSAERAYEALGKLPALQPAMSPFAGDDRERRALAAYLAALGAGAAPPP